MSDAPATLIERLRKGRLAYRTASGAVYAGPTAIETEAADSIAQLERDLAEAKAERDRLIEKGFDLITERDNAKAENVRLTSRITDATEDKARWQARAQAAEAERDRLAAEVERLKAEVKRLYRPAHFID